jgi:hypothetical protein
MLLPADGVAGIKTFVVGIPGSDLYVSTLDAMAVAGGVPASATSPKYYAVSAMGGVAGLQQVFESITKQLITSCRLQLQSNPPDLNLLNVYVDSQVIPKPGPTGGIRHDDLTPTIRSKVSLREHRGHGGHPHRGPIRLSHGRRSLTRLARSDVPMLPEGAIH